MKSSAAHIMDASDVHPGGDAGGNVLDSLNDFIKHTEVKRLINQIVTAQSHTGFRSLAVLSEYRGEGKTFFVAALALAYARFLPSRVLMVNTVSQPRGGGLFLESILGMHAPESHSRRGLVEPGRVDLITTRGSEGGPFDSSDFHVASYIEGLASRYDVVLIDTCAMSEAGKDNVDPIIVAKHADTSVLVTSPRSVDRSTLTQLKRKLRRYGIQPLGTVYNTGVTGRWMNRR